MTQPPFPQQPNRNQPPMQGAVPPHYPMPVRPQQPGSGSFPPPPTPPVHPAKKQGKQPQNNKKWTILAIFAVLGLIVGILGFRFVHKTIKTTTVIKLPGAPVIDDTGKLAINENSEEENAENDAPKTLADVAEVEGEPWDGKSRITLLAMGMDYRDWEAQEKFARTDSMMLLSYDPITKMAGMLSIPRDLWVSIPNHGYGRINTAYYLGEAENLPGGGPQLAMDTVSLFLGVKIDYYAVISFEGFAEFIDAIDKLAINVKDKITVDPIGPGNTVTLYPGVQDLDGKTALAYARFRYSTGGDFERAQRQQDILYAMYKQITWQLPQLLAKPDKVITAINHAVRTNLTIPDILKLAWTVKGLTPGQIVRSVIAPPYQVDFRKTPDGSQDILVPIPDKIREARDVIFSTSMAAGPATISEDPATLIRDEGARVTLLNGSSDPGLFDRTVNYLQQYGITVAAQGQAANSYANALEINTGKPFTAKFIRDIMKIPTEAITMNYIPGNNVDLVVTITDAWKNDNPMGQ